MKLGSQEKVESEEPVIKVEKVVEPDNDKIREASSILEKANTTLYEIQIREGNTKIKELPTLNFLLRFRKV